MRLNVAQFAILAGTALFATGCSSIIEGTSQEIQIVTNPSDAQCKFMREGQVIGSIHTTPSALTVQKTKHDITILCDKTGFHTATYLNHSGVAGATWGNIVAGGGIGWAVDSISGADNKYTSPVNLTLVPLTAPAPAPESNVPPTKADGNAEGKPTS
ncbi:hypothetical protein [Niveispirillum sp. KHB5.9]|uniref:hypothetical protein n=1 Tax=Niveispirillum sp. KHB5.9 TaxID=3400269 RepID=UPI003A8B9DD5